MEHWLNVLCKRGGVKWRNCYQRIVNVTQLFTDSLCVLSTHLSYYYVTFIDSGLCRK